MTTRPRRSYLPGIASGETIATLAFTEPNGRWDESRHRGHRHRRRRHAGRSQRHQVVRARRPHRRPDHRRGPHRRRRAACSPSHGDAAGLTRTAAVHHGPDPQAGQARASTASPGTLIGTDGGGWDVLVDRARPRRGGPRRRAGRWRPEVPRHGRRVRQGPRAVRSPDRLVPGHQAQVRRHAARGRVGQVRRLLRRLVRLGAERRAARRWPAWPRPTARRPTSTPPPRTSRSTAASASPGSTRPTCTSSGPSRSELLFGDPTYHRELLAQRIGI